MEKKKKNRMCKYVFISSFHKIKTELLKKRKKI